MNDIRPGEIVDVAIKGVRLAGIKALNGAPTIADEHEDEYPMPPQAVLTRPNSLLPELYRDPRVRSARALLEASRDADGQVEAARWWGRLEEALNGVLDAIGEVPPF